MTAPTALTPVEGNHMMHTLLRNVVVNPRSHAMAVRSKKREEPSY